MVTKVRKITNISGSQVPVQISDSTTIYLGQGEELQNKDVYNLSEIQGFVKVEQDLSEVPNLNEKKRLLFS